MSDLIARFRERYVTPAPGVEEPDPLLVELDGYLTQLEAVRAAAVALSGDLEVCTAIDDPCPICAADEGHEDDCPAPPLLAALEVAGG